MLFEEIGTIVQTACYAHDMGNPPFGHSGEKAMQAFFTEGPGISLKDKVSPHFWAVLLILKTTSGYNTLVYRADCRK